MGKFISITDCSEECYWVLWLQLLFEKISQIHYHCISLFIKSWKKKGFLKPQKTQTWKAQKKHKLEKHRKNIWRLLIEGDRAGKRAWSPSREATNSYWSQAKLGRVCARVCVCTFVCVTFLAFVGGLHRTHYLLPCWYWSVVYRSLTVNYVSLTN